MTVKRYAAEEVAAAKSYLAKRVKMETSVYFLQRHSKTGARRYLRVFVVVGGEIVCVTHYVARACDFRLDSSRQEIVIDGGGFSAANEIASDLSRVLFGKGGQLRDAML